ncbi:nucleotidyltransferase family protein [Neobacillus terrae]|uniref:nucleotidyltransferase family protein n=1 Tax=Neobacillus terrae TaxID=3034837 RepID=UPI00140CA211|nr:nucleotidyltransferase family protein [Neobacillus terrae]NHM33796.1 nucleotidyltransferase family protein [Neobacillus terrae]
MELKTEEDIIHMIIKDKWMMDILKTVKNLGLPDWWICAGFVRSKIWDVLHGFDERTPLPDVDVIYFDPEFADEAIEKQWERKLKSISPNVPWSVKNQARMHKVNSRDPYSSSIDGISKFPETVTALGVKLDEKDRLVLAAPWGVRDVILLEVRPTPFFSRTSEGRKIFENRVERKKWSCIWQRIKVYHD